MPKRIALNLALLALASLLCLGLSEIATRLLFGDQVLLFPRYHTSAHYGAYTLRRLRPNFQFWHTDRDGSWKFVTNAQGFRSDKDFHVDKPPGVFRIIALGDSTTEGFEVRQDYTYSAVLARYLRQNGVDAEVFNTGISGFGTAEELLYLENAGIKYHPDAVVLGFYSNDFDDNVRSDLFHLEGGKLVAANTAYIPGVRILDLINAVPPLRWLSENSYFYSFAMNTVWEASKRALLGTDERRRETELTVGSSLNNYKEQLAIALIHRLYMFCRAHNIILIILDIPQPDIRAANIGAPKIGPPKTDATVERGFLASVPAKLQNQFRENSDALIPSEEVFGPYRGLAQLFGLGGLGHPNEFAHLMMGTAVGRELRSLLALRRGDALRLSHDKRARYG